MLGKQSPFPASSLVHLMSWQKSGFLKRDKDGNPIEDGQGQWLREPGTPAPMAMVTAKVLGSPFRLNNLARSASRFVGTDEAFTGATALKPPMKTPRRRIPDPRG